MKQITLEINIYYFKFIIFLLLFILNFFTIKAKGNSKKRYENINPQMNNIIKDNFFIIDSNNLEEIHSHMYGFSVSKKGILTNNYYKKLGCYEEPDPMGVYVMIRKIEDEIIINQDFSGNFGIYIYENKNSGYFALSNSFLLLEEYLVGKQNFTINKDYADSLIISGLCSPSIYETMVNEITIIPPNAFIIINIKKNDFKIYYIDYKESSIPLESKEGLKIIDKWIDKWRYILRSLKKKTDNISIDLSGGFDSRLVLSIFLNSDIDINSVKINSYNDTRHTHEEDFKIASNISIKFGFKLNSFNLDNNGTQMSLKDSLFCTIYSKLGFHKEFYTITKFFNKPRFSFSGAGGGMLRGYPGLPINKYTETLTSGYYKIFYNSSMRICNRSVNLLKKLKTYYNDYEISRDLYSKGRGRHHFGKTALVEFLVNSYQFQPLIDPDIKKIKFDISENSFHDLIAYIYIRLAPDLIYFPFDGKRVLNPASIKKAKKLNNKFLPYKGKSDYNENFYLDNLRKSPVPPSKDNINVEKYLLELFESSKFIQLISQIYNIQVYNWAKRLINRTNFQPLRHLYGLFAVAKTLEDLSLNRRYIKNLKSQKHHKEDVIDKLIN